MKTFKLTITQDELKALIRHHKIHVSDTSVETSARIHDLTKRLNRDSAEIETEKTEPQAEEKTAQPQTQGWA